MTANAYPPQLGAAVADIQMRLECIAAWPQALERHAAMEDVGVLYARHLESAMAEADVARALEHRP